MFGQRNWLVILVSGSSLQLVGLGDDRVQTIPLPNSIVSNMEVINKDGLYTLITDWIKQRTYTSAGIIWLLAPDICFEHLLISGEQDKIDSETLQFLDTVPFENTLSRIYNTAEGKQIFAVNKDLVMALVQGYSLHGYTTKAVVPSRLVQTDSTLTTQAESYAIKHATDLSRESLIAAIAPVLASPSPTPTPPSHDPSKPKSSLPLLLGVFGVLLAILVFVLVLNK